MSIPDIRKIFFVSGFVFCFLFSSFFANGQERRKGSTKYLPQQQAEELTVILPDYFSGFDLTADSADYLISLCANVPNSRKPHKVIYNQQTGHVFLILQQVKKTVTDTIHKVFGFYPKRGLPALVFKSIKSNIKDNSLRWYNAGITKKINREDFGQVLHLAFQQSQKKYHINKYNCYDYAVLVFNAVAGNDTLPVTHVRFPFIFGKGGSPTGLYADLKQMKERGSNTVSEIRFGSFQAPVSTGRKLRR